jgi:hypothetical protein
VLEREPAPQLIVLGGPDQDADGFAGQLGGLLDRLGDDQRVLMGLLS